MKIDFHENMKIIGVILLILLNGALGSMNNLEVQNDSCDDYNILLVETISGFFDVRIGILVE